MTTKGDKTFGLRIKELREKKKFTQEQLAEILDIDSRSLSRIETGISFTTLEKLKKLANALDVDIQDLFYTEQSANKEELIAKINTLLNSAQIEDLQKIYKIILTILR